MKTVGDYVLEREISPEGPLGEVTYVGWHKTNPSVRFAVKALPKTDVLANAGKRTAFFEEFDAHRTTAHKNVVACVDVRETKHYIYLVLELTTQGSLRTLLQEKGKLPLDQALDYTRQILSGLSALHTRGILHRDLSPPKLYLFAGDVIKIGDLSTVTTATEQGQMLVGAPEFRAPEVLRGRGYSRKADVWSVGVLFYRMIVGELPWKGSTDYEVWNAIERHDMPGFLRRAFADVEVDEDTLSFAVAMLNVDADKRPECNDLLAFKVFRHYQTVENLKKNPNGKGLTDDGDVLPFQIPSNFGSRVMRPGQAPAAKSDKQAKETPKVVASPDDIGFVRTIGEKFAQISRQMKLLQRLEELLEGKISATTLPILDRMARDTMSKLIALESELDRRIKLWGASAPSLFEEVTMLQQLCETMRLSLDGCYEELNKAKHRILTPDDLRLCDAICFDPTKLQRQISLDLQFIRTNSGLSGDAELSKVLDELNSGKKA